MKNVLAFGNPLLDITILSKNIQHLLDRYNLQINGQKEISRHEMELLSKDIQSLPQQVSPGGCCQNSLRVLQWVLKKKCNVSIFGSVGKDAEADILRTILQSEGVHTRYMEDKDLPTGKTIALISKLYRSLVAHIGAAEVFPLEFLHSYKDFPFLFESASIILIEAYFLTNRFDATKYVVDLTLSTGKLLAFNLCGSYIFKVVPEPIKYLVNTADIVFGNIFEYKELCNLLNAESIDQMASDLITHHESNKYGKILVITDGANPVKCYFRKEMLSMSPPNITESDIKDTTGAGDAFIGGFLAGLTLSRNIEECINLGFYAASNIIKQSGCTLPKYESEIQ